MEEQEEVGEVMGGVVGGGRLAFLGSVYYSTAPALDRTSMPTGLLRIKLAFTREARPPNRTAPLIRTDGVAAIFRSPQHHLSRFLSFAPPQYLLPLSQASTLVLYCWLQRFYHEVWFNSS